MLWPIVRFRKSFFFSFCSAAPLLLFWSAHSASILCVHAPRSSGDWIIFARFPKFRSRIFGPYSARLMVKLLLTIHRNWMCVHYTRWQNDFLFQYRYNSFWFRRFNILLHGANTLNFIVYFYSFNFVGQLPRWMADHCFQRWFIGGNFQHCCIV